MDPIRRRRGAFRSTLRGVFGLYGVRGQPSSDTFLRGDQWWARPPGIPLSSADLNAAISAFFPIGSMFPVAGTLASIALKLASMPGWFLADGTSGTLDMRNHFIKGWSAGVDPGTSGGSLTHTHAAHSYTPAGSLSAPTLTMSSYTPAGSNASSSFTPTGSLSWPLSVPIFTGSSGTIPAQTISWPAGVPTFAGSSANTSSVSGGTPSGTVSAIAASVTPLQTLLASVPLLTGLPATHTHPAPTFTGSALAGHQHTQTATGTISWPAAPPTNATVSFTPVGTLAWPASVPAFAGIPGTVPAQSFTGTPAVLTGTVSTPTFAGTSASLAHDTVNHEPTYYKLAFIQKVA